MATKNPKMKEKEEMLLPNKKFTVMVIRVLKELKESTSNLMRFIKDLMRATPT